ncbi:MAG: methyltransferase domain protein [Bacteroidetes bacterium]|nr:methyltransferase domain protein [Bacteroidota bacterium]
MNNDNNNSTLEQCSIHDFDLNMICDYFSTMERQGPGCDEMTLKALSFIKPLTAESKVADIGCGTGKQTIVLAQHLPSKVVAIDLFQKFIDILNQNSKGLGLQEKLTGIVGNMETLPFQEEEYDLLWSEGAIYNIGFQKGITEWRKFLKKGGYIAVTEASWFTNERPEEIDQFWKDAYPEIDTISNKIHQIENAGYIPVATFILPEYCWIENFYELQKEAREIFLSKHKGNPTAEALAANEKHEYDLYRKYKSYYGYVFYIGKKI